MDFEIPTELADYLKQLDDFIEREIKPLEQADDNIRFFDHRRENARTDWDRGGLPNQEWEALLAEARRRADAAVDAANTRSLTQPTPHPAKSDASAPRYIQK